MRMYRVINLPPVLNAVVRYAQTALKPSARTVDSLSMISGSTTAQSGEAPLITQTHKVEWDHHGRWLVTITACRPRLADGNGNQLAGSKHSRLSRMRREHSRGRFDSKAERNLAHGLGEVRRIASALGLSKSIRNQACQHFRSAQNEDLLRGRSIEAIAAGSVYATCRCNGLGRTIEEIAALARVKQQRVMNAYKVLN